MAHLLKVAACLFWTLPLSAAIFSWSRNGYFTPDLYYLLGIPLGMIALTILTQRLAKGSSYRVPILIAASGIALFGGLSWLGIWGADV